MQSFKEYIAESKISAIRKTKDDRLIGLMTSKGAKLPTIIVVRFFDGLLVMDIKPQKYKKELANKVMWQYGATDDEIALFKLISSFKYEPFEERWNSKEMDMSMLQKDFKEIFNDVQFFESVNKEFKRYMTVKVGIPEEAFKEYFGEAEGDDGDVDNHNDFEVHNGKLRIPDSLSDKKLELFGNLLEEVYKTLKQHGIEDLFNITFTVTEQMSAKVNGQYDPSNDIIMLNPRIRGGNIDDKKRTIIHELGHRMHYKSSQINQEVYDRFDELKKAGEAGKTMDQFIEKYKDKIQNGTIIEYVGRSKKNIKKGQKFEVGSVKDNTVVFSEIQTLNPSIYKLSLKGLLAGEDWAFYVGNDKFNVNIRDFETGETENWFPTRYSETNQHEWFAEMFAQYIQDKLKGKPKEFIEGIIKEYKKEVG